ncbi:hypothetical protein ACP70R_045779 [Stipagrostis hirtigluma subsp. patula]
MKSDMKGYTEMSTPISSRRSTPGAALGALAFQLLAAALAGPIALPGCPESCGDVRVPYPFGIGRGCFHQGFNLTCDTKHRLFLGDGVEVLGISLPDGTVRIRRHALGSGNGSAVFNGSWCRRGPSRCRARATPSWRSGATWWRSSSPTARSARSPTPPSAPPFARRHSAPPRAPACPSLNNAKLLTSANSQIFTHAMEPASICREHTDAHQRKASRTSQGLITIIVISAGFGLLFSLLGVAKITKKHKQQRNKKLRQKFFKRNHGLLFQQLISSNNDIAERMKIFSLEELEQATNKFDQNRILGGGGHGTVYKGILSDQRVVAIKKSKIVVQREIYQFINEVVILSHTNHRNVVKLFGCCLETEFPLLVYEFISNGTLSYNLHGQNENPLSWKDRLRIALETATAIAYLHSAASISVFHRDIKSANILLTDNLTAKVSDFGASRSISIDETGVLTAIQGTHAELLTRVKPVFSSHSSEGTSLASYFVSMIRDNHLVDILDPQIVEEGGAGDAEVVARLAEACLSLKGEERPTMRQVEMALEDMQGSKVHLNSQVIPRTSQNAAKDQSYKRNKGSEGTRLYSLEEDFIQASEIPR